MRCFLSDIIFMDEVQEYSLRLEPISDKKLGEENELTKSIYNK